MKQYTLVKLNRYWHNFILRF